MDYLTAYGWIWQIVCIFWAAFGSKCVKCLISRYHISAVMICLSDQWFDSDSFGYSRCRGWSWQAWPQFDSVRWWKSSGSRRKELCGGYRWSELPNLTYIIIYLAYSLSSLCLSFAERCCLNSPSETSCLCLSFAERCSLHSPSEACSVSSSLCMSFAESSRKWAISNFEVGRYKDI